MEDVVRAMVSLAECKEAVGEIFNIGGDTEISIDELARKAIQLSGNTSTIEYISYDEAFSEGFEDMKRRAPDISKIYEFIGWKPKVALDEILTRMIKYARDSWLISP